MAQCQKPLPVGASGSCTCSESDFVPAGTLLQTSAGDVFAPAQPKPLRMNLTGNTLPGRSGLDSVNGAACACASSAPLAKSATEAAAMTAASGECVSFI